MIETHYTDEWELRDKDQVHPSHRTAVYLKEDVDKAFKELDAFYQKYYDELQSLLDEVIEDVKYYDLEGDGEMCTYSEGLCDAYEEVLQKFNDWFIEPEPNEEDWEE